MEENIFLIIGHGRPLVIKNLHHNQKEEFNFGRDFKYCPWPFRKTTVMIMIYCKYTKMYESAC